MERTALLERARMLRSLGRSTQAIPFLMDMLRDDPEDIEALQELALAFLAAGSPERALGPAAHCYGLDPDSEMSAYVYSATLYIAARAREALPVLQQGLQYSPESARLHWLAAQVHESLGQVPQALARARDALQLEPGRASYHELVGRLKVSRGAWNEAEHHARQALSETPDSAGALIVLGKAVRHRQGGGASLPIFHEAVRNAPGDESIRREFYIQVRESYPGPFWKLFWLSLGARWFLIFTLCFFGHLPEAIISGLVLNLLLAPGTILWLVARKPEWLLRKSRGWERLPDDTRQFILDLWRRDWGTQGCLLVPGIVGLLIISSFFDLIPLLGGIVAWGTVYSKQDAN